MVKFKASYVEDKMIESRGINPRGIYCLQTGEEIGIISREELTLAIFLADADSEEELFDDLEVRCLAAMRPSIAWNVIDSKTLHKMRLRRPRQLLSYLMIRMYEPRDNQYSRLKLPFDRRIANLRARVQMWQLVSALPLDELQLNELLLVLLRIDALFNLNHVAIKNTLPAPATMVNREATQAYIDRMNEWLEYLYAKKIRQDNLAKAGAEFWMRGATTSRDASVKLFLEVKPKSETTLKREAKKKADSEMEALLKSIMDAAAQGADLKTVASPTPKPQGFIPAGGLKLNLVGRK